MLNQVSLAWGFWGLTTLVLPFCHFYQWLTILLAHQKRWILTVVHFFCSPILLLVDFRTSLTTGHIAIECAGAYYICQACHTREKRILSLSPFFDSELLTLGACLHNGYYNKVLRISRQGHSSSCWVFATLRQQEMLKKNYTSCRSSRNMTSPGILSSLEARKALLILAVSCVYLHVHV